MSAYLSERWFDVATLRPRLREHLHVSRQRFRGQPWYVVQDRLSNRAHRFSATAWSMACRFDGVHSVDQAWQSALDTMGEAAPTQDEVIGLLAQLHGADLLLSQACPDSGELLARRARQRRPAWRTALANPLSVRCALWDPDRFLNATVAYVRPLIGTRGALAWLAIVLPALWLAAQHSIELSANLSDRLLTPDALLGLALVFPFLKLLHELGHAYAVKAGGGEVHEAGLMLLVFAPAPYVDASAASAFRSKWCRAFVGAAGMLTELLVAAVAMYVWTAVEPGAVRAIAFNVMLVAGVSTLLFNANPLMRYDGYYILTDVTELPNLAQRANAHVSTLVRRYLLRDGDVERSGATPAEARWFVLYAPAAFVCRLAISLSIAGFLANHYLLLGVVLAIWSISALAVVPGIGALAFLFTSPTLVRKRTRALCVSGALLAMIVGLATLVPLPSTTTVQGVVWVPEGAEVRATAAGFAVHGLPTPGLVQPQQTLLELENSSATALLREQAARVAQWRVQATLDLSEDRVKSIQSQAALAREASTLADLQGRVRELVMAAPRAGMFLPAQAHPLTGRFVQRGELIGYVLPGRARTTLRVAVPQDEIAQVMMRLASIDIRLADRPDNTFSGVVARVVPQGSDAVPSRALTVAGGGDLVADPNDPAGLRTLDNVFQLDVELAGAHSDARIGTRAYVRLRYQPETLLQRGWRGLRQLLLSSLHV